MFPKLIKETQIDVESRTVDVRFYLTRTIKGVSRYSAVVEFHPDDHMILDADSVSGLETKLWSLVRASIYSRMLVGSGTAA